MQRTEWQLGFTTPAFLGNAEQRAQWRTPPFKALLRQWWRVLAWSGGEHTIDTLRREEGLWFGVAADDGGESQQSKQSKVRLRLESAWEDGKLTQWPAGKGKVNHPEVGQAGQDVDAELYLGYGPLNSERGAGTSLNTVRGTTTKRSAIEPEKQSATLKIAAPGDFPLDDLMQLLAWFGTLGSRSRNGWGSLIVKDLLPPTAAHPLLARISRPLDDCLQRDWPHAIGHDRNGLLFWKTPPKPNWRDAMKEMARVKIAFRTQPSLSLEGVRDGTFAGRHVLAYPVTHHAVVGPYDRETKSLGWVEALSYDLPKKDKAGYMVQSGRLANQLRFKVLKEGNQYIGLAFHLPCRLPDELANRLAPDDRAHLRAQEINVWRAVHAVLDREMTRLGGVQ